MSRLLKMTGLFCKRAPQKRLYSAKDTHNFKETINCDTYALLSCPCIHCNTFVLLCVKSLACNTVFCSNKIHGHEGMLQTTAQICCSEYMDTKGGQESTIANHKCHN